MSPTTLLPRSLLLKMAKNVTTFSFWELVQFFGTQADLILEKKRIFIEMPLIPLSQTVYSVLFEIFMMVHRRAISSW